MTWIRVVNETQGLGVQEHAGVDAPLFDHRTKAILDALLEDHERGVLILCSDGRTVIEVRPDRGCPPDGAIRTLDVASDGDARPSRGLAAVLSDIRSILTCWNACFERSQTTRECDDSVRRVA